MGGETGEFPSSLRHEGCSIPHSFMLCPTLRRYFCAVAALILSQNCASALVLDWDSVSWVDGTLNNTFNVSGNDVTVDVSANNGAALAPFSGLPNPQTPTIGNSFQGGLATAENTLILAVDLDNSLQSITVTVSFAAFGGATDVSFKLFDIDAGGPYQDQVTSIQALSTDGTTLIAPTITTSANNTPIGTGLSQSVVGTATTPSTGANSGRGNVTIDFGTNDIQSFTFTYGSTAAFLDPAYQHFGLYDIDFTPVPEINPALISVLSCLTAAGLVLRRRSKPSR